MGEGCSASIKIRDYPARIAVGHEEPDLAVLHQVGFIIKSQFALGSGFSRDTSTHRAWRTRNLENKNDSKAAFLGICWDFRVQEGCRVGFLGLGFFLLVWRLEKLEERMVWEEVPELSVKSVGNGRVCRNIEVQDLI